MTNRNPPTAESEIDNWFGTEHRRLWLFLRSRLPCDADADDLSQTVYLKAKTGRFENGTNVQSFVFTIALNCIRDQFRGKKRQGVALNESDEAVSTREDDNPLMILIQSEEGSRRTERLRHCLGELSDDERIVVSSRMQGKPHQDIADQCGWKSANRSEKTFLRAKQKLSDCVTTSPSHQHALT